jgi:hypothetical protein
MYHILCWLWCPEIKTNSVDWAQLSRLFNLKTETDSNFRNDVFLIKNRTMDNIQKRNNCIITPSSQTSGP